MKYFCLGYIEEKKWETMSECERNAMLDECFAYDDVCGRTVTLLAGKRSKAPGTRSRCDGRMARCPSPMARMPRRKSSWAESSCSKPRT